MARLENINPLSRGLSGKIGDLIFRQVGNKTIVSASPRTSPKRTPNQLRQERNFQMASLYATSVLKSKVGTEYEHIARINKLSNARSAAMKDFLSKPQLKSTFLSGLEHWSLLYIRFTDNYKPKEVDVAMLDETGAIVQNGKASFTFGDRDWQLLFSNPNAKSISAARLLIRDRIGNVFWLEAQVRYTPV